LPKSLEAIRTKHSEIGNPVLVYAITSPIGTDRFKQMTRPEFHQAFGKTAAIDINAGGALLIKCISIPPKSEVHEFFLKH
jgi:hypothetical protein